MRHAVPDVVRRFLLSSIPSIPHLELLLLLWRESACTWSVEAITARLYVPERMVARIAEEFCEADLLERDHRSLGYRFRSSPALNELLTAVDESYSCRLREVTLCIHANAHAEAGPVEPR
jgi:hypothetical protein